MIRPTWIFECKFVDKSEDPTFTTINLYAHINDRSIGATLTLDQKNRMARVVFRGHYASVCAHEFMAYLLRFIVDAPDLESNPFGNTMPKMLLDVSSSGLYPEIRCEPVIDMRAAGEMIAGYFGDVCLEAL